MNPLRAGRGLREAAVARAGELEGVAGQTKVHVPGQLTNGVFDAGGIDGHYLAAGVTDEVVVMAFIAHGVAMAAIHVDAAEHAALLEQFQGTVNSGTADA